jgi:ABC-type polysaccharide/polyol phosphate export permease
VTTSSPVLESQSAATSRESVIAEALPDEARPSIFGDLREIVSELRRSRDLVHQLTLRDIRVRYKQAIFGFGWAVLIPAAVVLSGLVVRFALAKSAGRQFMSSELASMAIKSVPWGFFVGSLNNATASLVANIALVTKVYFPREVLPLSAILSQTFDTLIGVVLVTLLLPFIGVTASIQMLWVPVLLLLLWMFVLAIGLFLSCANVFFRDVKYLVHVFLMFGIFVTPVILDATAFGHRGSQWMMLNPIAPLLEGLRLTIVDHRSLLTEIMAPPSRITEAFVFWHPWFLIYSAVWAVGGLLASAILFHRSERRFAEIV